MGGNTPIYPSLVPALFCVCKSQTPTEFGAKIGASIVKGYTFVDHYSWDAYNESADLPL